jgi:hypothetical protein
MKLCYRGVFYESAPATDTFAPEQTLQPYTLKYRGCIYTVNPAAQRQVVSVRPNVKLTYRGVTYGLNDTAQPQSIAPRPAATRAQVAAIHRENLYRNVQRRLQVAIEQGNEELIHLLEQELHQIV